MPVLADERLIGLVTAENVGEFFMIRSALQCRSVAGQPPPAPAKVPPVIAVRTAIAAPPILPVYRPSRSI
jgi:hypothetical protein